MDLSISNKECPTLKTTKTVSILICCLAIIAFLLYQLEVFQVKEKGSDNEKDIIEVFNEKKEETEKVIESEKTEENKDSINKDELVAMIMDSTLYFDNIQGEYTIFDSSMNMLTEVTYAADMVSLKGMYYKKNNSVEFTSMSYGDTKKNTIIDEMAKTYRTIGWLGENQEDVDSYSTLDRLYRGLSKDPAAENIIMIDVVNSHFVQGLKNYTDWEFEEITFLEMPSYLIQGIDSNYTDGDKFEMVVEKSTGVVLDYQLFDKNSEVMFTINTKSIHIDKGIDGSEFEWDSTGYEEVRNPSDVREEDLPDDEKD